MYELPSLSASLSWARLILNLWALLHVAGFSVDFTSIQRFLFNLGNLQHVQQHTRSVMHHELRDFVLLQAINNQVYLPTLVYIGHKVALLS